jgi:hypothetical protein
MPPDLAEIEHRQARHVRVTVVLAVAVMVGLLVTRSPLWIALGVPALSIAASVALWLAARWVRRKADQTKFDSD